MANWNMQFSFCFHITDKVRHTSHNNNSYITSLAWARLCSETTFNQSRIQLSHANANPVSLLYFSHRLPKHLHWFYFFLLLEKRQFNCITNFCLAREDCACNDSPLTFYLEAMVNWKQKVFACSSVSVRNIDHFQNSINQIFKPHTLNLLISLFGTWVRTYWHNLEISAELSATHLNF